MQKRFFLLCSLLLIFASGSILHKPPTDLSSDKPWVTVYAHGIVDGPSQMQRFIPAISTQEKYAVEFADSMPATGWNLNTSIFKLTNLLAKKHVNRKKMFMGQGPDIQTIHDKISNLPNQPNIILYGCSRGAATTINYLATYNPTNIKAVILDATPADMPATLALPLARAGIDPKKCTSWFKTLFPAYPSKAITPLQAIASITNKQLPILLLHSQTDTKVPYQHSLMLYQEFIKQGFCNVHLVILPTSKHSYSLQDYKVRNFYLNVVHSFYQRYHAPYNAQFTQTPFDFESQEWPANHIAACLQDYDDQIEQIYQKAVKRNIGISSFCGIICIAALLL